MSERPFNLGDFADLPPELERTLEALPETARAGARAAIRQGLTDLQGLDPSLRIRSRRMDAIVGCSRDWWVLPEPTIQEIVTALTAAISMLGLMDTPVIGQFLGAAVFQWGIMARGRTKVSHEQAIVLRVLRHAHKGTGWTLARIADELPDGFRLTQAELADVIEDLRSLRTVHGEKPAWSIEENPQSPGHYWTLRV